MSSERSPWCSSRRASVRPTDQLDGRPGIEGPTTSLDPGLPPLPPESAGPLEPEWQPGRAAFVGLCLGLVLLVATLYFSVGQPALHTPAAATPTTVVPETADPTPTPSASRRPTPPPTPPDPDKANLGAGVAFGKVIETDGSTLILTSPFGGKKTTVHTHPRTKVYVLIATHVGALRVGAALAVYGRKHPDGSVTADVITGTSLGLLVPRGTWDGPLSTARSTLSKNPLPTGGGIHSP